MRDIYKEPMILRFGLEVLWKQIGQIHGIIVVVPMNILQEENQPVSIVYIVRLAAAEQGINYGSILGSTIVAAEHPVFSTQCNRPDGILTQIVVHFEAAVQMIPGQFVINAVRVADGASNSSLGQNLGIFGHEPFFEGHHDGIRKSGSHLRPLLEREVLLVSLPFHFIEQADLLQSKHPVNPVFFLQLNTPIFA